MFACGSYPAYPTFLESVELEARQNVRRLCHHPSIVIYAGGNENHYIQEHFGLSYDWEDKDPQSWLKTSFPSRYIYQYLLPKVVEEEAPSVSYRPDSPWNDGRPITSWDRTTGDLHQWNGQFSHPGWRLQQVAINSVKSTVWHVAMRPYQDYPQIGGRFNSEFGMQSFPHLSTIDQFVTEISERHPQSATMDFHNKCRDHEQRLATYIRNNFMAADSSLKVRIRSSRQSPLAMCNLGGFADMTRKSFRTGYIFRTFYNQKPCTTHTAAGAETGEARIPDGVAAPWSGS